MELAIGASYDIGLRCIEPPKYVLPRKQPPLQPKGWLKKIDFPPSQSNRISFEFPKTHDENMLILWKGRHGLHYKKFMHMRHFSIYQKCIFSSSFGIVPLQWRTVARHDTVNLNGIVLTRAVVSDTVDVNRVTMVHANEIFTGRSYFSSTNFGGIRK